MTNDTDFKAKVEAVMVRLRGDGPRRKGRPRVVPADAGKFLLRLPENLLIELRGFAVVKSEDSSKPMSLNTLLCKLLEEWVKTQTPFDRSQARRLAAGERTSVAERKPEVGAEPVQEEVLGLGITKRDMQEVFKIHPAKYHRRIRESGISPDAALLMDDETYNQTEPNDRLLLGWKYWCNKENLPETDEALLRGAWAPRPKPVMPSPQVYERLAIEGLPPQRFGRSGQETFADYLAEASREKDAKKTMLSWLSGVVRHYDVWMQLRARSGSTSPSVASRVRVEGYGYDARATWFLPDAADDVQESVEQKLSSIRIDSNEYSRVTYLNDYSLLLGFAVHVRKLLTPRFVLADQAVAEIQWLRRMNRFTEANERAFECGLAETLVAPPNTEATT